MYSCFHLVMLSLLWSLVEVHSQTFPYVSFMSQISLANNSYVDISLVGRPEDGGDSVQCHTDLGTCCGPVDGSHRGDWYFPDGTILGFSGNGDIYEQRVSQRVDLRRRNNANSPTGIYRCDIPTNAVHHATDISVRDTVYVGLYPASGGTVSISGGVTFDSDQLTLTCISTGGPATTVTWTRDSTTVTQGTQTVLNDPVTAQYTHTLTVAGRLGGLYRCTVSNNKPSVVSKTFTVRVASAPTNLVFEVQSDGTSVLLTWTPPDPLGDTTGYRISFTGGGSSGSVDVSGGSTNSYTLTGLIRGETYDISIVGTSDHISSESVELSVTLVHGPYLTVEVVMMGVSSISLSWSVAGDTVVDSEVVWRAISGPGDRDSSGSITSTSYTIPDLQKLSVFSVTVTVRTSSSGDFSESVIAFTVPACGSSGSSSSVAVAALGGVLGVVIVTAIAVQVMVIVFFMKKLQRAEEYTATLAARLKR
ncbi:Receptor-type tyrosine-protein phosphatase H [Geodia barretti]|nr:Receptor-type tyrosine-protein phosphatase H [Geodia barretti]